MNFEDYLALQKKAEKESAAAEAADKSPYVPCLDEILGGASMGTTVNLGLIAMPIDRIVGTDTKSRAVSFSPSFLPLLGSGTEFCHKYIPLYNSCETEGLREPVTGFEYMGNYYIREGNKRVSVSKLLNLPEVDGVIARVNPLPSDKSPEAELNREYIKFYDATHGINFAYFSKPASFRKFYELLLGEQKEFTEELKLEAKALFSRFQMEYRKHKNLPLSAADAFLSYLTIRGFEDAMHSSTDELKADIGRIWKEFQTETLEDPIAVSEKPLENNEESFIKKLINRNKVTRIAFVHMGNIQNSAWVYSHELSRQYLEEKAFHGEVETDSYYDVSIEDAEQVLRNLCEQKYDVIFTTSAQHGPACTKVAIDYSDVKILNCSLNASTKFVRTYYLRTYESKYLIGILAGAYTQTGRIAYVADYPVYGTIASINAFALGVSAVNPSARIYLTWTSKKDSDPEEQILNTGCDIISDLDWSSPRNQTRKFGLYARSDSEEHPINLAAPLWDWGKLYEEIVKAIRNGNWNVEEDAAGAQALGYWWGLSSGAVDFIYSKRVMPQSIRLVNFLKKKISEAEYYIFEGEIAYSDGTVVRPKSHLTYTELIEMDKLLWNIVGSIPTSNQLKDNIISLAKVQGVLEDE